MMIVSIRRFLLVNLLLAIIFTTFLTAAGNYYLDQKDIEHHLDNLLKQAAFSFQALLGRNVSPYELNQIQKSVNAIPAQIIRHQNNNDDTDTALDQKYQFQVWNKKGQLLLHSTNAPSSHLSDKESGFSNKIIDHHQWRSYARYDPRSGIRVEVAEEYNVRNQLENAIKQDDIYILLIIYPLAGLLIWFIIGSGLRSIDRVAKEVSHRLPSYLDPVDTTIVPDEIKPLVIELNKLFTRLQQALEREKRFAGDAAHELRTPLAALKTQAQVALKTNDDAERIMMLNNLIASVDRCTHIVQQLLTLSRLAPEANLLTDATTVNLAKLTSESIAQLAPYAVEKQIDIELIANEEKTMILGNLTALNILVRNLVDNAIRYTPEGGIIKVFVEVSEDDKVHLRVIDNGPGIPTDLQSRVFERFFRVLGNKSQGSGLGLAIVQQIVQLHNAQIKLALPQAGKGLEVDVSFPHFV